MLDESGRIVSTREPNLRHGPLFTLVRSRRTVIWAVYADLPADLAERVGRLAAKDLPDDPREAPQHAEQYKMARIMAYEGI